MISIYALQEAAREFEIDGDAAFEKVRKDYGEDTALILLVAHLRRDFGSMGSHPPDREIDRRVLAHLFNMDSLWR